MAPLGDRANECLEWDRVADEVVAILRSEAGRDPYDVRFHDAGIKRLHHRVGGDLELT